MMGNNPQDALIGYAMFFTDHTYDTLADLVVINENNDYSRLITREGIEWKIAKMRERIREVFDELHGYKIISPHDSDSGDRSWGKIGNVESST